MVEKFRLPAGGTCHREYAQDRPAYRQALHRRSGRRTRRPVGGTDLTKRFVNYDPDSRQPWRNLLSENDPTPSPIAVPAFIVQGTADRLVLPTVTADYVRTLCRANKAVSFLKLSGIDHSLIAEKSAAQVVNWIEDRFKGVRASSSCGR